MRRWGWSLGCACLAFLSGCSTSSTNVVATGGASTGGSSSGGTSSGGASTGGTGGSAGSGTGGGGASQRVFVTSAALYTGEFGPGAAGADKTCTSYAKAATLSGTWRAILSDDVTDAKKRVTVSGRVLNMKGETVANDAADLWDGKLGAPIGYDEHGDPASGEVWSATNPDGTRTSNACISWSDQGGAAVLAGSAGVTDSTWISNVQGQCSDKAVLYCLEQ